MSLKLRSRTSHLGDADLVRYMDHQLDREGIRRARLHLAVCSQCATRLDEFQGHASLVSGALGQMPVEIPDPGKRAVALAALERARVRRSATGPLRGSVLLRAAGFVLLALTAVLATSPGRAWMADQIEQIAGENPGPLAERILAWLGHGEPPVAASPPLAADSVTEMDIAIPEAEPPVRRVAIPPGAAPPVRFSPQGRDVVIEFAAVQDSGVAVISIEAVREASAQVVAGSAGEALTPTLDGLRVRNREGSRATYMITIPSTFRFIRVRLADREIPIRVTRAPFTWTIDLRYSAME